MANEVRLIDANDLSEELSSLSVMINGLRAGKGVLNEFMKQFRESVLRIVDEQPTVDAVEASRLGDLGRLMMPYIGCPRGRMGARCDGRIIELDPITDVEGDIWVPVLEEDLNFLKAKAVEVVHGRWVHPKGYVVSNGFLCSECAYGTTSYRPIRPCSNGVCLADEQGNFYYPPEYKYCPNCGADMRERKTVNLEDIVDLDAQTKANNEAMRKVINFIAGGADNERKAD